MGMKKWQNLTLIGNKPRILKIKKVNKYKKFKVMKINKILYLN